MKVVRGIKIGGLQQKIFNLMLVIILALITVYAAVSIYQQKNLTHIVQEADDRQQEAIETVSAETMRSVLTTSMSRTTALQAYIANDLFADVRTDVLTLQAIATELFAHADSLSAHAYHLPNAADDGVATVQIQHEEGVDPAESEALGLVANMGEIMLAMYKNSDKLDSCFIATPDGCILYVDDRAGSYFTPEGEYVTFDVRSRPWYTQAVSEGELIFTGVELDAFTDIPGLVCAAPVYRDGELVAVVGADVFLTSISDYVRDTSSENGFLCVINEDGHVLFSPQTEGIFKPELTARAADLRQNGNAALAAFIDKALAERTALTLIEVDGKEYYMTGAPMETLGWSVISVVEKKITEQPTAAMLERYEQINREARDIFAKGSKLSTQTILLMTITVVLLAAAASLALARRVVEPLEHMTKRINALGGKEVFEMEDIYRTDDEIEILAESFATLSKRTRDYIAQITQITAEKERIGTELALANRIQAAMMPHIFPPFPGRSEFDIYADMKPAKEVGGDFYDFFLVDEDHLCMVMADVSGKGVPAALFMMASKIILQSVAMLGASPAEILNKTNEAICSNNQEEMFVTVWVGILEISTGKLTAANAGHEYPVLKKTADSLFELIKDKHGFVIGGMEGARYKEYEMRLVPGSKLFLYTDGVPEATNEDGAMFGTERMLEALNAHPNATPDQLLMNIHESVDAFVKDAEQFDDLTMLCLEYKGGNMVDELIIEAQVDNLPQVQAFVDERLEAADCPMKTQMHLDVVVEEVFANIANYAYAPDKGDAVIRMEITGEPKIATITFLDRGMAYDPLSRTDPDVTLPAEEREIGGLGVFLTKKLMDDVSYERSDGQNILTIKKKL